MSKEFKAPIHWINMANQSRDTDPKNEVFYPGSRPEPSGRFHDLLAVLIIYVFFVHMPAFVKPFYGMLSVEDPFSLTMNATFLTSNISLLLSMLVLSVVYYFSFPWVEKYKIIKQPWHWQSDPEGFKKLLWKTVKNIFLCRILMTYAFLYVSKVIQFPKFHVSYESFPTTATFFVHIICSIYIEDAAFYITHRMFHIPWVYNLVHKQHHEYKQVNIFAINYAHPFEYCIGGFLPTALVSVVIPDMHLFTWLSWAVVRTLESTDNHCGYEIPWSPFRFIPFCASSNYHNYHHFTNQGNYSPIVTIWDTVCSTNEPYYNQFPSN